MFEHQATYLVPKYAQWIRYSGGVYHHSSIEINGATMIYIT